MNSKPERGYINGFHTDTHTHTQRDTHTHSHKCAHTHKDYSQKSRQTAYKDRTGWMVKCSLSCYFLLSCLYFLLLNPIKKKGGTKQQQQQKTHKTQNESITRIAISSTTHSQQRKHELGQEVKFRSD